MIADQSAAAAAQRRLVLDWQTIWRSELQALAVDREASDAVEVAVWAAAAFNSGRAIPAAGTDAPSRATASAPAPDARDAIVGLERRVAELERLLAQPAPGGS